ncbi:MAG: tRNA-dihydrouridine synthase B [Oleiphilaceae bacterium]|jgi:tRNA-dihydrouridine synthase B
MAGVTDRPFRQLCRDYGAAMAVSEMVIADPSFWKTQKSIHRLDHQGEDTPISVQIAGADPEMLAIAAQLNQDMGAQIIDINMGCPAKKVCNKAAGSALMKDEALVASILESVVSAVNIPVTLKIRTGWDTDNRNALAIAHIAEQSGIQALAIHGRTRQCAYRGDAEYETIARVKQLINIPVLANGDITTPEKAAYVLDKTNADGLLIGRAAQGCPWIFDDINYYLERGVRRPNRSQIEIKNILLKHVSQLHEFYGDIMGVRIARKHVAWYMKTQYNHQEFRKEFNQIESTNNQLKVITNYFKQITNQGEEAA